MSEKTCCRCNQTKPLDEFYAARNTLDKRQSHCKECDRKRDRAAEAKRAYEREVAIRIGAPKKCPRCERVLPLEEFYIDGKRPSGRKPYCIECEKAYINARNKTPERREKRRLAQREFIKKNPGYVKNRLRKFKERDPEKYKVWIRTKFLRSRYKISIEQYDEMLRAQDGKCAICEESDPKNVHGVMVVDHCHKTNKIRKLLCTLCNAALGGIRDNPETAERMASYLRTHAE